MKKFFVLWSREVALYFRSPTAYIVLFFFLLLTGFNFFFIVSAMNSGPFTGTLVEAYFNTVFFWFGFVIPFPLITMRLFSEEYKLGTIESLMTAPVRDTQILLAKYLSALFFYTILWVPSLLYFVLFQWQADRAAADAVGSMLGAYLMLFLLGAFYLAIGCLASALTSNQVVAAIMSFAAIAILFYFGFFNLVFLSISPQIRDLTMFFSAVEHMIQFSQGIFDTRPVVFYLSMTAFVLYLTLQVLQYRRWKG